MAPIAMDTGLLSRSSSNNLTTPTCCLQHCKTLDQPVTDLYRQNCPNHVFNRDLFPIQALLHSGFQKQRGIGYKMFLGYPKQPVWLKCNSCKGVLSEALDSVRSFFHSLYLISSGQSEIKLHTLWNTICPKQRMKSRFYPNALTTRLVKQS